MRLPNAKEQLALAREKFRELGMRLPETTAASG